MARPIDADKLLQELTALSHGQVWPGWTYEGVRLLIERQPTLAPPPQWISADEQKPQVPCIYLDGNGNRPNITFGVGTMITEEETLYFSDSMQELVLHMMLRGGEEDEFQGACWLNKLNSIRWWMPLPEPPETVDA